MLKPWLLRSALNTWGALVRAPGLRYQAVERWGSGAAADAADHRLGCRLPNGLTMSCDLRDHVQRQIYFFGCYEFIEAFLFCRLLRPGMSVLDAGANVGQYTLLASTAVGAAGTVHSFEPVRQNFLRLRQHVEQNRLKNVRLSELALWESKRRLSFCGEDEAASGNAGSFGVASATDRTFEVDAVALDDYLDAEHAAPPRLIKMDIEGAEAFALRGMRRTLGEAGPTILMEINRSACERAGTTPAVIWDELVGGLGYRAWVVDLVAARCLPLNSFDGIEQRNVILCRGELPDDVAGGWTVRHILRWARGAARLR